MAARQQRLWNLTEPSGATKPGPQIVPRKSKLRLFEAGNLETAAIILADPEKYGGEGSLLVEWAKKVMEKRA